MSREHVRQIVDAVSSWEGVSAAPHRFGGVEFNLGKVEIGHIHGNGMVDIPFTIRLREALVTTGEAGLHHLLQDSGWITFYVRNDADVTQALKLYRLSYVHKHYRRPSDRAGDAYAADLRALETGYAPAILAALYPARPDADEDIAADPAPPAES